MRGDGPGGGATDDLGGAAHHGHPAGSPGPVHGPRRGAGSSGAILRPASIPRSPPKPETSSPGHGSRHSPGSDLAVLLTAGNIGTLVLAGAATSGVVLSTVRQAADLDYRLTVLSDGCLDPDPEVHRVLTGKVFPRQASVATAAAWITGLRSDV